MKWYRLAAKQGSAKAQNNLGVMYFEGEGVKQDLKELKKRLNGTKPPQIKTMC
jgi:TPR repeat protein